VVLGTGLAIAVWGLATAAVAQSTLWATYLDQGRRAFDAESYADAEELFQAAIREVEADPQDPKLAEALYRLGRTERRLGSSELAEAHLERALAIFESELGSGASETAAVMVELGASHRAAGELELAEPLLRRGAAIREATSAPNSPELIEALGEIALLAFDRGDLVQAETVYRRVLAAAAQTFASDSPLMAATLLPMGRIYAAQGEYERALPLLRRALDAASPRQRGAVLAELAETHRLAGEESEAETRWTEAVEHYAALGVASPESVQTTYRFAEFLRHRERYEEAEPYFERALEGGRAVHGEGARELADILESYGVLLWHTGHKLRSTRMQTQAKWIRARRGKDSTE
jgi:tetratricopeptide (TPR) repeat protein